MRPGSTLPARVLPTLPCCAPPAPAGARHKRRPLCQQHDAGAGYARPRAAHLPHEVGARLPSFALSFWGSSLGAVRVASSLQAPPPTLKRMRTHPRVRPPPPPPGRPRRRTAEQLPGAFHPPPTLSLTCACATPPPPPPPPPHTHTPRRQVVPLDGGPVPRRLQPSQRGAARPGARNKRGGDAARRPRHLDTHQGAPRRCASSRPPSHRVAWPAAGPVSTPVPPGRAAVPPDCPAPSLQALYRLTEESRATIRGCTEDMCRISWLPRGSEGAGEDDLLPSQRD
jgi:hypothetical protein